MELKNGIADTEGMEEILTTPEQAEEFVSLEVDWFASAFGNMHGVPMIYHPTLREPPRARALPLIGLGTRTLSSK